MESFVTGAPGEHAKKLEKQAQVLVGEIYVSASYCTQTGHLVALDHTLEE